MGVALGHLDQIAFLQLSKSAGIPQSKPLIEPHLNIINLQMK